MRTIWSFLTALTLLVIASPAALADDGPLTPGVSLKVYHLERAYELIPDMAPGQLPNFHEIRETIDFPNRTAFGNRQRHFYAEVDAVLRIAEAGAYDFRLTSDDGSLLFIDEELVINHDGLHGIDEPKDGSAELAAGDHALKIRFFQAIQDTGLRLEWKAPGDNAFALIPGEKLFNTVGEDRPTAGGNKRVLVRGVRVARPGAGENLNAVHPSFTLEQARPENFQPQVGALCFLPNGMLAVTSFRPQNNGILREEFNGTLYVLGNLDAEDPNDITVTAITEDLHDPLGMVYVDDALYICDRNEVSKWTDSDGDGIPDERETFSSGWISDNYHHFTFGLPYDGEAFYVTLSTNITFNRHIDAEGFDRDFPLPAALNGPNPEYRGCLLRIDGETGEFEIVSGGLRTPNGVSLGPDGVILAPDNQGAWKPASGIYACQPGAFYGHYNDTASRSEFYPDGGVPSAFSLQDNGERIPVEEIDPPAVWIPQNECANSPGELIEIREGLQHAGQYLMAEITRGGIRRVFFEEVNGTLQGAIFRHSHGFEAGTNRLEWGPDGALYVGCMGGAGNWTWRGTTFGLQRMVPTEDTAFEFATIEATANGFRVTFTEPVPEEQLENLDNWAINAWTYLPTQGYGGPKREQHAANPTAAVASDDRLSVELTVPDRRANYVYHIRTDPTSDAGNTMWSPEAWYTFHQAPAE